MLERLSIGKVYKNACKYIATHLFAYIFLVAFYYFGSLLPILIGTTSFKYLLIPYYYLLLYFAAGFYYKHQLLAVWDKYFLTCALRFLVVMLLFIAMVLLCTFGINLILDIIKHAFVGGSALVFMILHSPTWAIFKYFFIFFLFVAFFIIPSFSFLSEITGRSRSILATYAKTKGNFLTICLVVFSAFALHLCTLLFFMWMKAGLFVTAAPFACVLSFISILYFKMYDFFYRQPVKKSSPEMQKSRPLEEFKIASINKIKTLMHYPFISTQRKPSQNGENNDVDQG